MPLTALIKTGFSALLDGPIIETLGQRASDKALSIVQQHLTLTAFEMAEAYQKSYSYALAAIGAGLAAPEQKRQFIQKLKHSKVKREFADQIEADYFQPFAAQQGVQAEVERDQLRIKLLESLHKLTKGPPIFTADKRPLTEAELAAVISYKGPLAITDLVLEQVRLVQGNLEDEALPEVPGLADFFRFNELLGNAVLFFFREIVRQDARAKTTLQVLQNSGLWADLRDLKRAQKTLETCLQQQFAKQKTLLKAVVDAGDFAQVTQLLPQLEQLRQSIAEVPQRLQAAHEAWQTSHQSLIAFARRFDGWASLLDEKVDNVLAAMDGLRGTVVRIDQNVQALLKNVDLLMQRLALSAQIKARDEFAAHSSASLALIEQALAQLKALPTTQEDRYRQLALKAGSLLFSTGNANNLAEAERLFVQARNSAKVPADKALACFNLFQVRLRRKAYDEALADLQCAIAIEPNYALHDVNKYPLVRILGAGGMGCVFLCHDQWGEGHQVVVKCFWEGRQGPHQQVFDEAMIMRKIASEYVPKPLDCGYVNAVQQQKPFFVTEYMEGTLDGETWLEKHGPLDVLTGLAVGIQIAKGLQIAHEQGIYHLDLKPANLLFSATKTGLEVKIIDFGLARVATSLKQHALTRRTAAGMTQMAQGIFLGTLYYAPPEQLGESDKYGPLGAKSDLFSFGAMLYRLMTTESPQNLNPLRLADAPAELFQLLCECKEENPERRPKSAQQVVKRLEAIQAKIEAERLKAPSKKTRFLGTAFAVVIVIVLVGWVWFNLPEKEPIPIGQSPTVDTESTPQVDNKSDIDEEETVSPPPVITEKNDTDEEETVSPPPAITEKNDTESIRLDKAGEVFVHGGVPDKGSCADYDFSDWIENGVIDTNSFVRVLRHNAPLYPKANSTRPRQHLRFGDALLPLRISSRRKRIQVRKIGTRTPLGWMEGHDLLCGLKPLQSNKGLDRKVFIKTPDSKDPSTATVPAYPSYQGPCNGRCKQLSRFRLYFIYAEDKDNQRYLVIDSHTLEGVSEPPPLVGWVEYGHTIPWNTILGLRPREEIEHISLQFKKNSNREGIKLGGGNIWYTLPIHIPILDINKDQQRYHVAAPGIGFEGFKQYENVLTNLKLVDIFFLIDGTTSMGPYIQAVKQAVEKIAYGLRNEPDFRETSFRFGFRIYRDTYADAITGLECSGGICEGMPLSTTTCQSNSQATKANLQAFVSRLGRVKEIRNDNDDYPEKLFNGMRQAIEDMEPCPDRSKMLFVIGDHGDKQQEWPHELVDDFNNAFERKVIFFIQTPKARKSRGYRWAYKTYRTQAFKFLDRVLPTEFNGIRIPRTDYFLSLNQTQLATQVIEQVKKYSPSALINELEQALAGEEALQTVLKRSMKAGGMPILYWKWNEETGCSELGRQCRTTVNHRVVDFYISTDKRKVQEEVWMTTDNLEDWLSLLRPFKNLVRLPVRKQRAKFVKLLRQQIQDILGGYPQEYITLSEFIAMARKNALPMREDSPLLQYTLKEIREIEGCEVLRLIEWVNAIRRVLQSVYNDSTQKVVLTLEYPRSSSCPLTAKGRKVPKLKIGRSTDLGPDETYRYDHTLYNNTVYWLPIDFLP